MLLAEPGSKGLQVRAARDGGWVDVPGRDGAFVVNIGELLEVATNGYLRATEHRVNLHRSIPTLKLSAQFAERAGLRADPVDPIFSVYGRNAWKSRLRAHPDVAAAHGYMTGIARDVTPGE